MSAPSRPIDVLGRPLRSLRVSVTDRCNLRCSYCMPEESYVWLPRRDILRFEEISLLVDAFLALGVDKLRLTGGEPLLRHDVPDLVALLAIRPSVRDLAMTTNGLRLAGYAGALKQAGLHRLTISVDTLDRDRFRRLTRRDELSRVLAGIDAAVAAGFAGTKLNTVVVRGYNDDELVPLLEFGRARGIEVRFIEYMDVAGATRWRIEDVVTKGEILARLSAHYGEIRPMEPPPGRTDPAEGWILPDGTTFGIVASTTAPFCRGCDRGRLTADGMWFLCLYAAAGLDLRAPLRAGANPAEIAELLRRRWHEREDRGAEERHAGRRRGAIPIAPELRRFPHLEMHTRGG
ncbi:MAG: GTP 3',8-cyclase MoaA [Planctomycetota bacterium]